MKHSLIAIAVASLLLPASHLHAKPTSSSETAPAMDTMVVTANRFEQAPSSVLAALTVVTRDEIEALQVTTALDVLETMPGVEVNSLGGKGQNTSIYLRGTSTKHTLVIVDGVKINSPTAGGASLGLIPAFAIERIEVVRGPRAAVYGSDAIGGVISITTLSSAKSLHQAKLGYGSDKHTLGAWRSAGALNDNTQGALVLANERSDGQEIYEMTSDSHGFDAQTALGSLRHVFNEQWVVQLHGYLLNSEAEYASQFGGPKNLSETEFYTLAASLRYQSGDWTSQLQMSATGNDAKDGDARGLNAKTGLDARRNSVSWLNTYHGIDDLDVNVGIDLEKEIAERGAANTTQYAKTEKDNRALFMTALYQLPFATFEGSVRRDDDSAFGDHTTWNLGVGVKVTQGVELVASSGTAFKAPTFNDLYWPGSGNPTLKPETSKSHEVGLRLYQDWFDLEIAAYQSDLDDMIAWAPIGENGTWIPANVEKARISGIEVEGRFDTGPVSHRVSAEWKDPEDRADDSQLIRRAKQNYAWTAIYSADDYDLSAVANHVGKRKDSTGKDMSAYTTLDIGGRYHATDQLTLGLRVKNALDEEFRVAHGSGGNYYVGEGRHLFADLTYQF